MDQRDLLGEIISQASAESALITVLGSRRTVPATRVDNYLGLRFREAGVLVTVVTRNLGPDLPEITRIDDLEPFLRAMEDISHDEIAAWFAARRADRLHEM